MSIMTATLPASAPHTPIDTGKVANRRRLRFGSIDEVLGDVGALVAAERVGNLERLGNWTLGQALGHLSTWINFGYDGYPPSLNPPFFIKWIIKARKRRYIHEGMPSGVKIPRIAGGTVGTDVFSTDDGVHRFRHAMERLRAAPPAGPNIIFGPLTHEEWIQLHLRHAELHLSFFAVK
jgi:hypothetical protein